MEKNIVKELGCNGKKKARKRKRQEGEEKQTTKNKKERKKREKRRTEEGGDSHIFAFSSLEYGSIKNKLVSKKGRNCDLRGEGGEERKRKKKRGRRRGKGREERGINNREE